MQVWLFISIENKAILDTKLDSELKNLSNSQNQAFDFPELFTLKKAFNNFFLLQQTKLD